MSLIRFNGIVSISKQFRKIIITHYKYYTHNHQTSGTVFFPFWNITSYYCLQTEQFSALTVDQRFPVPCKHNQLCWHQWWGSVVQTFIITFTSFLYWNAYIVVILDNVLRICMILYKLRKVSIFGWKKGKELCAS